MIDELARRHFLHLAWLALPSVALAADGAQPAGGVRVAAVWAFVGAGTGRMLISFTPAGQMEAFFREVSKANAMPPQDPALWKAHGMELLGPPLAV